MGDFNGSVATKTVRDDEFKVQLVDGGSGESASNKLTITASGEALVSATDLDIRSLLFASDAVDVSGSTIDANITNTSIAVTATDLDIRSLTFATDSVDASGSSVDANITNASIAVTATDLDIRSLAHATDSVSIGDGTETLAINTDGSINVVPLNEGALVCDYKTTAAVASDATVSHDYVVTDTKIFEGTHLIVGCSASIKIELGTYSGTTFTPKAVYFQQPSLNFGIPIEAIALLGNGSDAVRVRITNLDNQASDVYSTLMGIEK